jgi:hypothetical protein
MFESIREAALQIHFLVALLALPVIAGIVSVMGKWAIRPRPVGQAVAAGAAYAGAILLLLFITYSLAVNAP